MPSTALLVITDGRPCLQQTLASAEEFLLPYIDGPTVLVSDSRHELGLSGAVRHGWDRIGDGVAVGNGYVFHLEDDFVFRAPVPVAEMIDLLEREKLDQVALKRDSVNLWEASAGGFMQANPGNYEQRDGWTESYFGFTFNPCIYQINGLLNLRADWEGEAGLTGAILARDPDDRFGEPGPARFGIFGNIDDDPLCFHIGDERAAGWKL